MPSLADLGKTYGAAVGLPLLSGFLNRRAAGNATKTLATGGQDAIDTISQSNAGIQDLLKQIYGANKDTLSPYAEAGPAAVKALQDATGPGGALVKPFTSADVNLASDPGMQFRIENGMKLLNRNQASTGSLNSGAAWIAKERKAQDLASQEFQNAFTRDFTTDQANKENLRQALMAQIGVGQNAANTEVNAGNTYATQSVEAEKAKTQAIADLQTQIASAQAQGDVAKANALTDTLNGINTGMQNIKDMKTLATILSPAAKASTGMSGIIAAGGGGDAIAAGVPDIGAAIAGTPAATAGAVAGSAPLTGYAGGGLVTSHGAAIGMLTNPITLGVAAAIIGTTAWLKSQAHWEANTFVKNVQNKFGQQLGSAVDQFNAAAQSGQLSKADAVQVKAEVQQLLQQFEASRQDFATKGKDNKKVADQAKAEMDKDFGPNFSTLLQGFDNTIARLS